MLKKLVAVLMLASGWGCARYQMKPLQPIVPSARLAAFKSRNLDDPVLTAFLNDNLRSPIALPRTRWDLPALTLVALYYHPEISLARAQAAVADAAVVTASARPNPVFDFVTTREREKSETANGLTPLDALLPWILTPSLNLPFQRGRELRAVQARHSADVARWDVPSAAWRIRSRLRAAFVDYAFTIKELEFLREEEALRSEYLSLLEAKLELGDIARLEIEPFRIELQRIRLQVNAGEGRVAELRALMPGLLGLPAATVAEMEFADPRFDSPPTLTDDQLELLESDALVNRIDIRRGLDEYAAAEATLQTEVAGQRPDFSLGPAFRWREGQQRWTLGFSIDLPVFNRNEGPIAEAEARREEAAVRFDQLQASVIADVEQAAASYRATVREYQRS